MSSELLGKSETLMGGRRLELRSALKRAVLSRAGDRLKGITSLSQVEGSRPSLLSILRPLLPYLSLTFAALLWAGNFIVGRAVHTTTPPIALTFWRWVTVMLILLPVGLPSLIRQREALRQNWHRVVLQGFTGIAIYSVLVYSSLHHTTALNASLLLSTAPVMILLFSKLFYKQRVVGWQAIGSAISLLGALTIITRGDLGTLTRLQFNSGDLLMMAGVMFWAAYSLQLQHRPKGLSPWAMLTASVIAGVIILAPLYLWELSTGARIVLTPETIGAIVYISLFAALGGYFLWSKGVAAIGANKAGLFLHLIPIFAAILAILLLGERARLFHGMGISLVVLGLYLTNTASAAEEYNAK